MIKKIGVLWGFLFLLGGILGFVPAVTKDEMFLGVFMVNTPHNILHLASGLIFLLAAGLGASFVRWWFIIFGLFYSSMSVIGFVVGDALIFNAISNSKVDTWGHGFLGLILFVTGFRSLQHSCCLESRQTNKKDEKSVDKNDVGPHLQTAPREGQSSAASSTKNSNPRDQSYKSSPEPKSLERFCSVRTTVLGIGFFDAK